jgi:hypothetical protein
MLDRNTTVSAYVSSLGLSALSLNLNELVALGGLALAAATFLINWRYKHLHYRLAAKTRKEAVNVAED